MKKIYFPWVLSFILFGCQNDVTVNNAEIEPVSHTIYSDKHELFVEFNPLIVGELSDFAAHFTVLGDNFTPLKDAKVTVSLVMGDSGIRNSVDSCSTPGLYKLSLEPDKAGRGKLIFDVVTKTYKDRIVIDNVQVFSTAEEARNRTKGKEVSEDITFLKEQSWKIEFANIPVRRQNFTTVIKTSGQLLSAPGDEMIVVAKASGIVFFPNVLYEGSSVKKGQTLFSVSGEDLNELNLDANYREARANLIKAKADFERAENLVRDKIITQKEFLEAKLNLENAENLFNNLSGNYSAKGKQSLAPMDGYIKNILVKEGQFIEAGMPIATVSRNKRLMLHAMVSQSYFNQLSEITSANFTAGPNSKTIYNTASINGSKPVIGQSTAANSPFIPVTFEIDNTGLIVPGSVVEVYLKSTPIEDALVIPLSSLLEEQGIFYVFVQVSGEQFQKREVRLGANDGLYVQVLSGISENERVVTKGVYQLKLASASGALPAHSHEH